MSELLRQFVNSQSSSDDMSDDGESDDGSDAGDFSNDRCGGCEQRLGVRVGIYIYTKRDVKGAEIVLCDACADCDREQMREDFWVSDRCHVIARTYIDNLIACSDPGECNFYPNWRDQQIMANLKNLHLYSQLQLGLYVGTPPSKDLAECSTELVVALQTTSDDEIRGDIAVAMGQQHEEIRLALVRVGACPALTSALTSSSCEETKEKIDFSLRSLARHSTGRAVACAALVDALAPTASLGHRSNGGVVLVITKLARGDDGREALIAAGARPALVAAAALERDAEATRLFSDAIALVSISKPKVVTKTNAISKPKAATKATAISKPKTTPGKKTSSHSKKNAA